MVMRAILQHSLILQLASLGNRGGGLQEHFLLTSCLMETYPKTSQEHQKLISLLSVEMENRHKKVFHAVINANVLIMPTAFDLARDDFPTVVLWNDTALLVMLLSLQSPLTIMYIRFRFGPVRFDFGPGLTLGSWIMMRHVPCILLLEWSTTSQRLWVYRISVQYAQKDPRFLFQKRRGQPREFWSLISTIDSSTLPQDCVEEQLC